MISNGFINKYVSNYASFYFYIYKICKFLFKKIKAPTFFPFKQDLLQLTTSPHLENILSEETLVAGIQRYFFDKIYKYGNLYLFSNHHCIISIFELDSKTGSFK